MKVLNVMLGRGLGGIEQALLDYRDALAMAGHDGHLLIHPQAAIGAVLEERQLPFHTLSNLGAWDLSAVWRLRRLQKKLGCEAAIAHGNRAVSLLARAGVRPLIAPLHNYKIDCRKLTAALYPTTHLAEHAKAQGMTSTQLFYVPNMVRAIAPVARKKHAPLIIGSMGRFVAKKGFDIFIRALGELKAHGVHFRAILGGSGPLEAQLKTLAAQLGLAEQLQFTGWVEDKQAFFDAIDIFCLPSHHEPFGIVLLEAMAQSLPVVATDSEGPSEILQNGLNGLLVPKANPTALARAVMTLIADAQRTQIMAKNACETVRERYDVRVASAKLDLALSAAIRL